MKVPEGRIQKQTIDEIFGSLGYVERWAGHGVVGYKLERQDHSSLPETITLNIPLVAVDGTLWFERDLLFDLFDRISDSSDGGNVVIRALKKLDS